MNSATVAEANLDLLRNGKHCDVVFIVGASKERIPCHQLILMSRSPVFEVMFSDRWKKPNNSGNAERIHSVDLPDVKPSVFWTFLYFIYADVFTTDLAEVIQILYVAHKYEVTPLVGRCEQFMKNNIELKYVIWFYETAQHFGLVSLKKTARDLMADEFSELVYDPSFKSIDEASLLTILSRVDLAIEDELQLFHALLWWSCQQLKLGSLSPSPSDQRKVLEKVLPFVRFPLMTTRDFAMIVIPKNILTSEESVKIFTYMTSDPVARVGLRANLGFPWQSRPRAGKEHPIEFYEDFRPADLELKYYGLSALQGLVSTPSYNETIQFSLKWDALNLVALESVALRGSKYKSVRFNEPAMESSWIVSMQVKKNDSTRASSTPDWTCLFEMKNIEIVSDQDTIVTIEPNLNLESDGQYQIFVGFLGEVSLPTASSDLPVPEPAENFTETRFFPTHKNSGIHLSELRIFNYSSSTSSRKDCWGHTSDHIQYSAHCIRSIKVHVCCAPRNLLTSPLQQ